MLDKLKVVAIVGLLMQALRMFGIDLSEGFEGAVKAMVDSLYVIIPVVMGWFVKERKVTLAALRTR